jgi:serine/threonine protein kinase
MCSGASLKFVPQEMDENLKTLLDVCLNVVPSKRPSPSELLNHEVFKIVENVQSTVKSCMKKVALYSGMLEICL